MSKIILLGIPSQYSKKAPKISFIIIGLYLLLLGALNFSRPDQNTFDKLSMTANFIAGFLFIIYGQIAFSRKAKAAPKISINDDIIEYKTSLFKNARHIKWQDVHAIEFSSYRVDFKLANTTETLVYEANADVSIEIKESLREFAEAKNIEVVGG
jgi:hypothetical protein